MMKPVSPSVRTLAATIQWETRTHRACPERVSSMNEVAVIPCSIGISVSRLGWADPPLDALGFQCTGGKKKARPPPAWSLARLSLPIVAALPAGAAAAPIVQSRTQGGGHVEERDQRQCQ